MNHKTEKRSRASSREVDERIKQRCKELVKQGKTHFDAELSLADALGISNTSLTSERLKTIGNYGITFEKKPYVSSSEVDERIKQRCKELVEQGKTHFDTESSLADALGIFTTSLTSERLKTISEFGITFEKKSYVSSSENNERINQGCKELIEQGKTHFDSQLSLADALGISNANLTSERLKTISELGITFEKKLQASSRVVDERIKQRCKELVEQGKTHFDTESSLADALGIQRSSLISERLKTIGDYGITFEKRPIASSREVDERIKQRCKELVNQGKTHFDTESSLLDALGISTISLTSERLKTISELGITYSTKKLPENLKYAIQDVEDNELQLDSIEALAQYSQDMLSRKLHLSKLEKAQKDKIASTNTSIRDFEPSEIKNILEGIVATFIDEGISDFSTLEVKLRLYLEGCYFSEETIASAFIEIGYSTELLFEDSIDKRLRLASYAKKNNIPKLNYVKKLPHINTSKNGDIYISSSIKRDFLKLWREYALIMIKNKLIGHVSKTPIPNTWDETLESLVNINESYAKAFFLDDEHLGILKHLSYEGIASLAFLGSRGAKDSLPKMYWALAARVRGFFVWLNSKGLALYHAKYVIFTGGDNTHKTIELFLSNNQATELYNNIIDNKSKNTNTALQKKFNQKNMHLHAKYLALMTDIKANLLELEQTQIQEYVNAASGYAEPSGTMQHREFVYDLLWANGNEKAIRPKTTQSLKEWHTSLYTSDNSISNNAMRWYNDLIQQSYTLAEFEKSESKYTITTIKSRLTHVHILIKYLSTFHKKLTRVELAQHLTPFYKGEQPNILEWAKANELEKTYRYGQRTLKLLFNSLDNNHKYHGVFTDTMALAPIKESRKLIRKGMELCIYNTLQGIPASKPPYSTTYILKRNASVDGSILDMSWWPHLESGLSPILPIYEWILAKLPRRSKHLRYADVDNFMQYNDSGEFQGFYFSTDKNFTDPSLFIPKISLMLLFSDKEIEFIKQYRDYIKAAYSNLSPVKYDGGNFGTIQPLFPHHNKNDVIAKEIVAGYHKKCMVATQIEINNLAPKGVYDNYYPAEEQKRMRDYLSKLEIIELKKSRKNRKLKFPTTHEEIGEITESTANNTFTDNQGIHNLRHAGATTLFHIGLDLTQIKVITGHKSFGILLDVYLHPQAKPFMDLVKNSYKHISSLEGTPRKIASQFVNQVTKELIESEDEKFIEKTLLDNGFFTMTRVIRNRDPQIFQMENKRTSDTISDGIQIASKFHPATWKSSNTSICPVDGRCPEGTNCCCALCPLALFHITFTEGIMKKIQDTSIEIELISNKLEETRRSGMVDNFQSLKNSHAALISELTAWFDVVAKLQVQLNKDGSPQKKVEAEKIGNKELNTYSHTNTKLLLFRNTTLNEAMLSTIIKGRELNESSPQDDNYVNRLSAQIYRVAAKKFDSETIEKMEKHKLEWLIEEYKNYPTDKQRALLEQYTMLENCAANNQIDFSKKIK